MQKPKKSLIALIFLPLFHLLGIFSSIDALMSARTSQGTIAWIVSLNTFPYLAVPAYWVFGRSKFEGYVIARRQEESELRSALSTAFFTPIRAQATSLPREQNGFKALERLAKMPSLGGNRVELLIDGADTFRSIFAGIEAAKRYLLVQFYIVRDDNLGRELKKRLIRKARQGIQVYFLYDEIGSYRLPAAYLNELTAAGVWVRPFHSTRGPGNRFQLNFRNHRKVVVADGRVGWLGGFNVGDEYLGYNKNIGPWRDTHMRIEGPAVLGLQLSFLEDWHWSTDTIPELDWEPQPASDSNVPVLILSSGPADRFETASLMIQHILQSAERRVWIVSPYFVPDEGVIAALKLAALRGVDVRIIIPETPDNVLVYYAAYAFINPLLEAGVDIYRYTEGFLHSKTFIVDEENVGIGTVNLDNRSFRLNFEITAVVADKQFTAKAERMFQDDFARSRKMTQDEIEAKPFWFRVTSRAAFLMAPVL